MCLTSKQQDREWKEPLSPQYVVLSTPFISELVDKVSEFIDKGFRPIGGILFSLHATIEYKDCDYVYMQAMFKPESRYIGMLLNNKKS